MTADARDKFINRRVFQQATAPNNNEVVSGLRHLTHKVRRNQHCPAFGRQILRQLTNPHHTFGIKTINRLIQNNVMGIAQDS